MASLRDTLANLVEQYKASDTPLANLMRGDTEGAKQSAANALQQATQDPYSGLNVLGTTKLVGKTAQELAHELAQKNAVEMLGLPKGNTAMDRAKALGFDIENPVYRGTTEHEVSLKPSTGHEHGIKGISTTFDPRYASMHGDVTMPLVSKKVNPMDYEDIINAFESKTGKDFYDITDEQLADFAKKQNINASILNDPFAGLDIRYLNPTDLRSKFAAFDPARANEPDLLAGAMALPIATDKDKRNKIIDLLKNK
jgi:hypothetical protein